MRVLLVAGLLAFLAACTAPIGDPDTIGDPPAFDSGLEPDADAGSGGGAASGGGGGAGGGAGGGVASGGGGGSGGGSASGGGAGGGVSPGGGAGGGTASGGGVGGGDAGAAKDAGVPDAGTLDSGAAADAGTSCSATGGDRATQVCRRWKCDRADLSEGTWNGSVDPACVAGDMTAAGRANALKLLNLYRFLAQLPEVTTDATKNANAQACALMMDANNALSHTPPTTWKCYAAAGATAAGQSNICSGRAVKCIDLYMSDTGNDTTIGHRRWFLSNQLGPVGIGGTTGGSCHTVIGGTGAAGKAWMSWPPPGPVPLESIAIPGVPSVDTVGWTVQTYSASYNLAGASVAVKENGVAKPVTVTQLGANYGSAYAIRFNPQGWASAAGKTYDVTVTLASGTTITYQVLPILCP